MIGKSDFRTIMSKRLGKRLHLLKNIRHLKNKDLSELLEVNNNQIHKYLEGQDYLKFCDLLYLCYKIKADPGFFLDIFNIEFNTEENIF